MAELDMNSGDPLAGLRPETVQAMRAAVERRLEHPGAEEELATAFLLLRDDARRSKLPAERLLVMLKALWESVPAVQRLPEETRRQQLAELATACITRYYGS